MIEPDYILIATSELKELKAKYSAAKNPIQSSSSVSFASYEYLISNLSSKTTKAHLNEMLFQIRDLIPKEFNEKNEFNECIERLRSHLPDGNAQVNNVLMQYQLHRVASKSSSESEKSKELNSFDSNEEMDQDNKKRCCNVL